MWSPGGRALPLRPPRVVFVVGLVSFSSTVIHILSLEVKRASKIKLKKVKSSGPLNFRCCEGVAVYTLWGSSRFFYSSSLPLRAGYSHSRFLSIYPVFVILEKLEPHTAKNQCLLSQFLFYLSRFLRPGTGLYYQKYLKYVYNRDLKFV